jgi:hypothetical protein
MNGRTPTKLGPGRATIGLATASLIMLWTLCADAATTFTGDTGFFSPALSRCSSPAFSARPATSMAKLPEQHFGAGGYCG